MNNERIHELAVVYLEFKKALDTAFSIPGVLEEARRLEKRRVGRPKKADDAALEVVRDAVIEQCRKNGKTVAWIAEQLKCSNRDIDRRVALIKKRNPRQKLK